MEYWRQCALWLINCKMLPPDHRVTWESAQVFDLAQTLRDGVLLCQLLNNLRPQSINLKEINLRPQMSQFLCLKNIRTFLAACCETFGMKRTELFEAFDLFDVRDFGKVRHRISTLFHHTHFVFLCFVLIQQQELVKHTHDAADKSNLRMALDAMKDLAQYINEVKRDNETLRDIAQYQKSIENLNQSLSVYGRPKGDGEVRFASGDKRAKQDRHIFLFDAAVIVCKRRGDNYEMKEVITLHHFKITNNPTSDKETRKWSYGLYLAHNQGQSGFEFFFKTKELRKKWLEQFGMAISNIRPENGTSNFHEFKMHTFDRITSCSSCHMLLRGIFNQGYLCSKCGIGAHKECLGRFGGCGKTDPGSLKTQDKSVHGRRSDPVSSIYPQVPKPVDYSTQPWFAGPMERLQAEAELISRGNSTYLVRHRSRELTEYAISIKYSNDVKHIKILNRDGCFHIAENNKFGSISELIEYYQHYSLREGFRSLDTTLQFPYREQESPAAVLCTNQPGGKTSLGAPPEVFLFHLSSQNMVTSALMSHHGCRCATERVSQPKSFLRSLQLLAHTA
ncbi:guanine nucleotide exchange factor VAV3-like [Salvelinus alpinus]